MAAGFSPFTLGDDLGGSIRVPSAFCGLWGLKSTFSALNMTDGNGPDSTYVFTRMAMASPGPLARTASDLKLMWDVLVQTPLDKNFRNLWNGNPLHQKI
ncbi:MAG: hypothetical protein IPL33_17335 [Sphingobacteriales bacterium]|nr:hypothetical protein [Sphingobacteriales bacterium]